MRTFDFRATDAKVDRAHWYATEKMVVCLVLTALEEKLCITLDPAEAEVLADQLRAEAAACRALQDEGSAAGP